MAEKLRIFVSATLDLEPVRAVIGRAAAELPIPIGLEIRRTSADGATHDAIFEQVANVDRFYFLLGRDITAPAGAEWHLAWKLERSILPLRAAVPRTPAAQDFQRFPLVEWHTFRSPAHLAKLITLDLARILHHPDNRYGLSPTDLALLARHARAVHKHGLRLQGVAGGAEGGGVLLDPLQRGEYELVINAPAPNAAQPEQNDDDDWLDDELAQLFMEE
jgi:hypothetical protein